MDFTEKTKNKNYLFKGRILNLRCDDVILPDGKEAKREIVEHNGGSAVLCVKDGKILFVEQFRYAYGELVLEIPAGKVEIGEDPKLTALRELEEEAGLTAKSIKKIFDVYPTPGYTSEIIRIYFVDDFDKTSTHLDEGEFLSAKWISVEEVKRMIEVGRIKDGKTIIAVQYYLLNK